MLHSDFGDEGHSFGVSCGDLEVKAESSRAEQYNSLTSSVTRDGQGGETTIGMTNEGHTGGIQVS